jgi:hypothetical protein
MADAKTAGSRSTLARRFIATAALVLAVWVFMTTFDGIVLVYTPMPRWDD